MRIAKSEMREMAVRCLGLDVVMMRLRGGRVGWEFVFEQRVGELLI